MNLADLQREMFTVIRQPLTEDERMRARTLDGRSTEEIAGKIIKPNDRLTSSERLEIYNRVYWFRILSCLAEDFQGLRAVLGEDKFDKLLTAYLTECPSQSFTLRNLGSRLEQWLTENPRYIAKAPRLAMDMVRLEWADVVCFDAAELPRLKEGELASMGEDPVFHLQPHLILLDLAFPVDDLLLRVRHAEDDSPGEQKEAEQKESDVASNIVRMEHASRKRKRLTLPKAKRTLVAVHRQDNEVFFKRLEPEAFALLRALQQGQRLSEAIETSVQWTSKKVQSITGQLHDWFANWSALGWFCVPPESRQS